MMHNALTDPANHRILCLRSTRKDPRRILSMKKLFSVLLIFLLAFSVIGCSAQAEEHRIVASFYPMYIFAMNVFDGIDEITLESMAAPETGCLHDYQLLTSDMKALAKAQALLVNGAGMESFLPGFRNVQVWEEGRKVPARRSVRVRDLLSMTSGLPYGGNPASPSSVEVQKIFEEIDEKLYREDSLSTVEIANRIGQCGLDFHPGDSWEYGVSADVLGAIVEIVSGKRFGEFLKEELLDPLGMEDTGFYVPKEKQERLACVYEKRGVELKLYKGDHLGIMNAQKKKPAFESGGAGMVSTLEDYSRFAAMLLNGGEYGGKQILRPDTVNYMTGGKLLPWQQEAMWKKWETLSGFGYGNLMRIMVEPGMAYHQGVKGEYGWDGWLGAYFCNIPSEKISILLSFQRAGTGTIGVTRKLRNLLTPGYIRGEG